MKLPTRLVAFVLLIVFLGVLSLGRAESQAGEDWNWIGSPLDLAGHRIEPSGKWVVVIFLGQECPLSNASIPRLNQLTKEFAERGVTLIGAYVDPTVSLRNLQDHQERFKILFPMVDDRAHSLVRLAGATVTPEVVVFSSTGRKLYQGRIDDRVGENGVARPAAVHEELREVLVALTAGKSPPIVAQPGYGCAIPTLPR